MKERRIGRFSIILSVAACGMIFLSGCATSEHISDDGMISESIVETENVTAETTDAPALETGNIILEKEESETVIEPENSFIFEGICKVNDTYEETDNQAPLETVAYALSKEKYERMVLLSHSVEENDGKMTDTVSYKIELSNPSGMVPQTILCSAVFEKEGASWNLSSNVWKDWTVKNLRLRGSDGHLKSVSPDNRKNWFGTDLSETDGEVYIHINKNLNVFCSLKGDDMSVFETNIGTNFSGTLYYVSDTKETETDFSCTEGYSNDDGILSLKLVTESGENYIIFDENYEYLSQTGLEAVITDNTDILSDKVLLENLDKFDITSESLFYGEWRKETGARNGNVSPELSWEKVEGAKEYLIFMIDLDDHDGFYILHWYGETEENHVDKGAFERNKGYIGPYPPSSREYSVYVFALNDDIGDLNLVLDSQGREPQKYVDMIEEESPGSIISYGVISGTYEYTQVW